MFANDDWLNSRSEPALDPHLPIVDAHHHVWDTLPLKKEAAPYDEAQFARDVASSGHNICATVYIEAGTHYLAEGPEYLACTGESGYADAIAERHLGHGSAIAAGIVGAIDLRSPHVGMVLDAHQAASPGRFRGVRQIFSWDEDESIRFQHVKTTPRMALGTGVVEATRMLGDRGLSLDALLFHHQLPDLADLAGRCPETEIVLNHVGCPIGVGRYAERRDEVFAQWKQGIDLLAKCPNVHCKLGGLNMKVNGFGWHERPLPPGSIEVFEATRAYYQYAIEAFGVARCMFESNFPPDRLSLGYGVVWNVFKRVAAGLSASERHQLFYANAAKFYRLSIPNLPEEAT